LSNKNGKRSGKSIWRVFISFEKERGAEGEKILRIERQKKELEGQSNYDVYAQQAQLDLRLSSCSTQGFCCLDIEEVGST
jgi:hypothetical protein